MTFLTEQEFNWVLDDLQTVLAHFKHANLAKKTINVLGDHNSDDPAATHFGLMPLANLHYFEFMKIGKTFIWLRVLIDYFRILSETPQSWARKDYTNSGMPELYHNYLLDLFDGVTREEVKRWSNGLRVLRDAYLLALFANIPISTLLFVQRKQICEVSFLDATKFKLNVLSNVNAKSLMSGTYHELMQRGFLVRLLLKHDYVFSATTLQLVPPFDDAMSDDEE